jgi:hypothetical protein
MSRFVVVRNGRGAKFSVWHDSFDEAKNEAKRLAQKERVPFTVLQEIGVAYVEETPVTFKVIQ